jgi:hypothetical protein
MIFNNLFDFLSILYSIIVSVASLRSVFEANLFVT